MTPAPVPVPFAEYEARDRRLHMLLALAAAVQYTANTVLLGRFVERVGLATSADRLAADVAWLAEQGLATTAAAQGVTVATITQRGLDVANGLATHPGVSRPAP
jgi:ABC-type branched-subunit amino acid transport system ATPase component